jgi:hypothetical protein
VSLAKKPSMALSHDAEVGVKWKVQRGCCASHLRIIPWDFWLARWLIPDADHRTHTARDDGGQTRDLSGSGAIPLHVMWP